MVDDEGLKYDVMVERALRGVLRDALRLVAERGLPGEHHFYITFRTDHPGTEVPERLLERYPNEMTIVLQNQFWGLEVQEESFAVTLSFNDLPERLSVPFESVVAFADPSVRFGLQFDSGVEDAGAEGGEDGEEEDKPSADVTALPVDRPKDSKKPLKLAGRRPRVRRVKTVEVKKAPADKTADQAEVVPLDTFRKK